MNISIKTVTGSSVMSQMAHYVSFHQFLFWSPSMCMYTCVVVYTYIYTHKYILYIQIRYIIYLNISYLNLLCVYIKENYKSFHVFLCHNNYYHQNNKFFCSFFFIFEFPFKFSNKFQEDFKNYCFKDYIYIESNKS